ncbi:MAG: hypothetical protein MI861_07010, partial [Pirellulales bacterium]|nr:hypothetical protein [Pirellulales bacterium]
KYIIDEEGHVFPRNQAVEVCTDTANKLQGAPYAGSFTIIEPGEDAGAGMSCSVNGYGNGSCC